MPVARVEARDFRDYAKTEVPGASARSYLLSLPPLLFLAFLLLFPSFFSPKDKLKSALATRENLLL